MNRKMLLGDPPSINITGHDLDRLDVLLEKASIKTNTPVLEFLRNEVDRARLVDEADVITPFVRIGSRVLFKDEAGKIYRRTLMLAGEISDEDKISILTPVGAALLGLSNGQSIAYETPDYRIKTITVLEISEHQPSTR
jgi:regulator of nucleoside diphosphate kinase